MLLSRGILIILILVIAISPLAFLLMPILAASIIIGGLVMMIWRWKRGLEVE